MSKILIIGNVLKDVYLKLDERGNHFECDDKGVSWLELGFDGASHPFYHRTSVYGGAAVSLSVLGKMGIEANILGSSVEYQNGELNGVGAPTDYRYIFCRHNDIAYFVPSQRKATDWTMPGASQGTPEWLFVDRSTTISPRLVDEIANFLKFAQGTKLAVHLEKRQSPAGQRLAEMADVLFLEEEPLLRGKDEIVDKIEPDKPNTQLVCHLTPRKIYFGDAEESWSLEHADTMTHLTIYSTIAATVLGVVAVGGTLADAILWGKLNAENASLQESLAAEKLQELAQKEFDKRHNVRLVARSLMTGHKGILAIDERNQTLAKRFQEFGIETSDERRKEYRELLLTTPGLKDAVNGVILSETTTREKMKNGVSFTDYLVNKGIIPGIKVDKGLAKMSKTGEEYTLGLEGLSEKLQHYFTKGFRFAKWRAVFRISKDRPSFFAIQRNAEDLATFAKECQLAGMTPMIEPEVLTEGDFSIEQDMDTTVRVLTAVLEKLDERRVDLAGCILKCNMITAGQGAERQALANEVGMATAAILRHAVPRYVAGVCLLGGEQEPKTATKNLTAIEQNSPFPWPVSFAFGRALQEPVLQIWKGEAKNAGNAQAALARHLAANVDALHYGEVEPRRANQSDGRIGVLEL